MEYKQLKKQLGLTTAQVAEFFGLSRLSFLNSSARERYERAFVKIYQFIKNKNKNKNK